MNNYDKRKIKKMFKDFSIIDNKLYIKKLQYDNIDNYLKSINYEKQHTYNNKTICDNIIEKDKLFEEIKQLEYKLYIFKLSIKCLSQLEFTAMWLMYKERYSINDCCTRLCVSKSKFYKIVDGACFKMYNLIS